MTKRAFGITLCVEGQRAARGGRNVKTIDARGKSHAAEILVGQVIGWRGSQTGKIGVGGGEVGVSLGRRPSDSWSAPLTMMPGGNPVTSGPGATPTSPETMLAPVLVTVLAPRTPKVSAEPRDCAWAVDAKIASAAQARKSPGTSPRRSELIRLCMMSSNWFQVSLPADPTGQTRELASEDTKKS